MEDNQAENRSPIPQDGAIRWIHGKVKLNMTNGSTSPTWKEDGILNYIKSIGVLLNGKDWKFKLPAATLFFYETLIKGENPYINNPIQTVDETYDSEFDFVIDFAENHLNESDTTALLQTKNLSNCELVISTGNADYIASANPPTINSAEIELDIREFFPTEKEQDINDDKVVRMTPFITSYKDVPLKSGRKQFDNDSQEIDLESDSGILHQLLIAKNDGARSNDLITDVKYFVARPSKKPFFERKWNSINTKNRIDYALRNRLVGVNFVNWVEKLGNRGGLRTNAKSYELLSLLTADAVDEDTDTIQITTVRV